MRSLAAIIGGSLQRDLFAWCIGVGNTFNIQEQGHSGKNPSLWWRLGLQLGGENEVLSS